MSSGQVSIFPREPFDYHQDNDFLGAGSFSSVFRCRLRGSDELMAVKVFHEDIRRTQREQELFMKEVGILQQLTGCPHVVQLVGVCISPGYHAIIMEYFENGDLENLLVYDESDHHSIINSWDCRMRMGLEIAQGMEFLHSLQPPIIHGDLKTANILIDSKYNCKIGDFGLSRAENEKVFVLSSFPEFSVPGTLAFVAPELFKRKLVPDNIKKADVYSYSIVLWQLKERKRPYEDCYALLIRANVLAGRRPPLSSDECSKHFLDLIVRCWDPEPDVRPAFTEIVRAFQGISALARLGPSAMSDYLKALSKGKLTIARGKLDMFGKEGAGKTCLGDSLMDLPYIAERASTKGARVKVIIRTGACQKDTWNEATVEDIIDKQLARGYLESSERQRKEEAFGKMDRAPAQYGDHQGRENEAHPAVEVDRQVGMAAASVEKLVRRRERNVLRMGLRALVFSPELTEEKAKFIELLKKDKEELRKCKELVVLTICDRGGQEQFLMSHAALMADSVPMADGSPVSSCAYMLVMDGTKSLDERLTDCSYRPEQGSQLLKKKRRGPRTRRDLLGYFMTCIEMAHPSVSSGPFLGQGIVKRAPVTFAVSTRQDEVKSMDSSFAEKQEQILQEVVEKHKFGEHMVLAETNPNKLIFRVDNKRSNTKSPDPVVQKLKKLIFDMIQSLWGKLETPLPWAVLDQLLSRASQLAGNEGKVLDIQEVYELARQVCDIATPGECETALKYLSTVSTIAFYSNVSGLKEKVFTDLQWLVDRLSVFVTVLDKSNLPPGFWHHLANLEKEGIMSWDLAHYLLVEARVNEDQFDPILKLLHLFDIICPAIESPDEKLEAVLKVGQSFFIPCMLAEEYSKQPAWQRIANSTVLPPSVVVCADGFAMIPEPLYFRLVSRCATAMSNPPPNLRRGYAVFHLDNNLELELVYHDLQCIIATIYSLDDDHLVSVCGLNDQCVHIRQYLIDNMNEAKKRGMDGLRFTLSVRPAYPGIPVDSIDYDSLVCIDDYPGNRNLVNRMHEGVSSLRFPTLHLWFSHQEMLQGCAAGIVTAGAHLHLSNPTFKGDEPVRTSSSNITEYAREIRSAACYLGGFWKRSTDIPVEVLHLVCRLTAENPYEFGDYLQVTEMDVLDKPKAGTPVQVVRQIMEVWIERESDEATLDELFRVLERMELLQLLKAKLKKRIDTAMEPK